MNFVVDANGTRWMRFGERYFMNAHDTFYEYMYLTELHDERVEADGMFNTVVSWPPADDTSLTNRYEFIDACRQYYGDVELTYEFMSHGFSDEYYHLVLNECRLGDKVSTNEILDIINTILDTGSYPMWIYGKIPISHIESIISAARFRVPVVCRVKL